MTIIKSVRTSVRTIAKRIKPMTAKYCIQSRYSRQYAYSWNQAVKWIAAMSDTVLVTNNWTGDIVSIKVQNSHGTKR